MRRSELAEQRLVSRRHELEQRLAALRGYEARRKRSEQPEVLAVLGDLCRTYRALAERHGWEAVRAKHKRVMIADDVQKQMAFLQLMMGQKISGTTGLKALGADWKEEQRLKAEEARTQAELQSRMQQAGFAQQIAKGQAAGAGAPGGGGAPGAPGGAQGQPQDPAQAGQPPAPVDQYLQRVSPDTPRGTNEMNQTADSLAQALLR